MEWGTLLSIDEKKLCRETPTIFHYTDFAAACSIIKSSEVWATHANHTNDAKELTAVEDWLIKKIIDVNWPIISTHLRMRPARSRSSLPLKEAVRRDVTAYVKSFFVARDKVAPTYLTCFTDHDTAALESGGNVSLWQAYGKSRGIALGFSSQHIVEITDELLRQHRLKYIFLERVRYRNVQDEPDLSSKMDGIVHGYSPFIKSIFKTGELRFPNEVQSSLSDFLVAASIHKVAAFSHEKEVRLIASAPIASASSSDDERKEIPVVLDSTVPRVAWPLLPALREILLGPGCGEAEARTMDQLLTERSHLNVKVRQAETPLRV